MDVGLKVSGYVTLAGGGARAGARLRQLWGVEVGRLFGDLDHTRDPSSVVG